MYLDPNGWSLILQCIIGFFVAIPIVIALFWGKVKDFFRRVFGGKKRA